MSFDSKSLQGITFYDNLNLEENELYFSINKKLSRKKSTENGKYYYGISFSGDSEDNEFIKLNSLFDLINELRNNEFVFDSPHWEKRARYIQGHLEL